MSTRFVKLLHFRLASLVAGALGGLAALTFVPRTALAQNFGDLPSGSNARVADIQGFGSQTPYWTVGHKRWFAAALFDVGGIFAKPEIHLGYGKPYYAWGGIEAWTKVTLDGVSFFAGPRLSIPHFQLRAGGRTFHSTNSHWLVPRQTYSRLQLDQVAPPLSHYGSLEAEMTVDAPLLGGNVALLASVHGLLGVDGNYNVFEDLLHVIVDPPWVVRTRLSYLRSFGRFENMALGAAGEVIYVPNRTATTARIGPVVTVSLTHHLQAVAAAMIVIAGRDSLGLSGSDIGQIGLRYRWATGDLWPEFP